MNRLSSLAFLLTGVTAVIFPAVPLSADVRLADIFTDNMVLQREQPLRIRGTAAAGEQVTVILNQSQAVTKASDSGHWEVSLPAQSASGTPVRFEVQATNRLVLQNVLIGEVWLCSGQSNMEWTVAISADAAAEIAAATDDQIRHIKIPLVAATTPQDRFNSAWQVCSPRTAGSFTACGYYMARRLRQELKVPVGLVNSSWGGTRIEPWTPPLGFQQVPALQNLSNSIIGRTPGTPQWNQRLQAHIDDLDRWLATARQAAQRSEPVAPSPAFPAELTPFSGNQDPTMLYNAMIHPLVGFPIRGAIWYQGESNHTEGLLYLEKMKALIGGWRALWNREFPFYYVQIAPFRYGSEDPTLLARFWEAQAQARSIPRTGMVVINDIATINDIHPPNKQDVGKRLAGLALKYDYGQPELVAESPEPDQLKLEQGKLRITFRNTGGGLKTRDGKAPSHFEITGPGSGGFQPADAVIDGDSITLSSPKVAAPSAWRFAWHMLAEPNLCGGTGLPVSAARGGEIPTFLNTLPVAAEYKLVYDLDLSKLSAEIRYDVDHSSEVGAFDRIAWLLELTSESGAQQNVFVSMDAFTKDVKKIAVPTVASGAVFQQAAANVDIFTDVQGLAAGKGLQACNIEFWPNNYAAANPAAIPEASDTVYDGGDEMVEPLEGYGSMQVHNHAAGQTVFAINNWRAGAAADIGIGNSPGDTRDWTFSGSSRGWQSKRLRVFVRPQKP
ncbi:MAG: sialate O-acetylesterase [Planctomycetaceae bacterium]